MGRTLLFDAFDSPRRFVSQSGFSHAILFMDEPLASFLTPAPQSKPPPSPAIALAQPAPQSLFHQQ